MSLISKPAAAYILTLILVLMELPFAYGQEKLSEKFLAISGEYTKTKNGASLAEGRELALKSIQKYGDDSEHYGVWAWLTYFNSTICIRQQVNELEDVAGMKGKEQVLLKEAEDALNKAYILAQSDNTFHWKYSGSKRNLLTQAAKSLIQAFKNQQVTLSNRIGNYDHYEKAHGHFDWILDYEGIDHEVALKIIDFNDALAETMLNRALRDGDTARALEMAQRFQDEITGDFYRAYLSLLADDVEGMIRIFEQNDREHWDYRRRGDGCEAFIRLFLEMGFSSHEHLEILVHGFGKATRFRHGQHRDLAKFLADSAYFESASLIYESGVAYAQREAKRSVSEETRKSFREYARELLIEHGEMYYERGMKEYYRYLEDASAAQATGKTYDVEAPLRRSKILYTSYSEECGGCLRAKHVLENIEETLKAYKLAKGS